MAGWLSEYDTEGYYGRDDTINRSAEFVYNHIKCPPMLIWLGEASGVDCEIVDSAQKAALIGKQSLAGQCAVIRKIMPWKYIEDALKVEKYNSNKVKTIISNVIPFKRK